MKKITKILCTVTIAASCCSIGKAQFNYSNSLVGATLIYSNGFSGTSSVSITNTTADYEAGVLGGSTGAMWIDAMGGNNDNGSIFADGSVTSTKANSWVLPFKPQTNYVYTMTATLTFAAALNTWVASGFESVYGVVNNSGGFNQGENAYDFAIIQTVNGNYQYFSGRSTAGYQLGNLNSSFSPVTGAPHTLTYILDTTAVTNWTIAGYLDGVPMINLPQPPGSGATTFTFTNVYLIPGTVTNLGPSGSSPTNIAAIALGQNAITTPANYRWNSMTLSAAPVVLGQQPAAAQVSVGTVFTNTVLVAATSPSYQWYYNSSSNYSGIAMTDSSGHISGSHTGSLIFTNLLVGDTGYYYVVITNSLGSITSSIAPMTVYTTPYLLTANPVTYGTGSTLYGGTTVGGTNYAGSTPTFSVSTLGGQPISYQWQTNGVNIAGATSASFTFTNCQLSGPTSFSCVASNSYGLTTTNWPVTYVSAPTAPFPQAVLSRQPIGYWRLNEAEVDNNGDNGVLANDYGSGDNGLYTNAYLGNSGYSPGKDPSETSMETATYSATVSGAFGIQGIDFAAPTNTSAIFSIGAWVNGISAQPANNGIVAKGYGGAEQFVLDVSGGKYRFAVRNAAGTLFSAAAISGPVNNGVTWHFVVGVCDEVNSHVSIYVDGILQTNVAAIPPGSGLLASSRPVSIGARSSTATANNDWQFKGFIDDVAIFNYALSASQVMGMYSSVTNVFPYFVQTPPASVSIDGGATLNLSAVASGSFPLGYSWTIGGTNVGTGSTNGIPLNISFAYANVPVSWNGSSLILTVTNAGGSTNVSVSLTVFSNVSIANDLPAQVLAVSGAPVTYSIGVTGEQPFTYQWYHAGSPVSNATNATYTATAGASGSTTYYVVISNAVNVVTSSVSTLTSIAEPTNGYAAGVLQLNPAGYWPMHEVEAAAQGDTEINYGTLGVLGTGYYADWVTNNGNFIRQVPGAITGNTDMALHFNYNVGDLGNGLGTWTNELYVPHTSPLSTLNPPFTVECWLLNTNTSSGELIQSVWGQLGLEGLNAGYAGSANAGGGGIQMSYNSTGQIAIYGYVNTAQSTLASANSVAPLGSWHHVVTTCSATTNFTVYVDGSSVATGAGVGKYTPDYWTPLAIGGTRGGTRSAIISVDEFAVYTNVITDISTHYSDGIGGAAGAYFHDVTNDNPVIYLRMDALPYTAPGTGSWPELVNYGGVGAPGNYSPGSMPGAGPALTATNYLGLSGTNVAILSGVSSFADAGYASAYNPTGSNADFTIIAMFHGNPCDNRVQAIASHGIGSWQLGISTNGTVVFNAGNGNAATSGSGSDPGDIKTTKVYNDGKWHFVAAVNSTNVVSIYVDGVLDTNGTPAGITPTSVIPGNTADVMIGADPSYTNSPAGVGRQFAGQVCEVAFVNEALTAAEVGNLYRLATTGSAVNTSPTTLTFSVSGGLLTLSWPSDHTGWTLQAQTNNPAGINTNWVSVPGSTLTNQVVYPLNGTDGSVFYRLRYP
jgi:hypothetical protein